MRGKGFFKVAAVLVLNVMVLNDMFGRKLAAVFTCGIMLYAWLGEYIALLKDNAISLNKLNDYERMKLIRARDTLIQDVKEISGANIAGLKLHIVPSDQVNAFAYGFKNVAVTRAAVNACDDMTLNAVLGHEISHILCMDAVLHRIVFADITLCLICLMIVSFVTVSFIWIIFGILCLAGICGGFVSVFLFSGLAKAVKGIYSILQRLVVFLYQTVMAVVSRGCEFRADRYSMDLGYGPQLSYFLSRFAGEQAYRQKTLREVLYDSHPAAYRRIQRIEQHNE